MYEFSEPKLVKAHLQMPRISCVLANIVLCISAILLTPEAFASDKSIDAQDETVHGRSDKFRVSTLRAWGYRNFLPDGDDADVFGLEMNSAWGWGNWNVTNIT